MRKREMMATEDDRTRQLQVVRKFARQWIAVPATNQGGRTRKKRKVSAAIVRLIQIERQMHVTKKAFDKMTEREKRDLFSVSQQDMERRWSGGDGAHQIVVPK